MKILNLCSGNRYRSQLAKGFLQFFDKNLEVKSAGTFPAYKVNSRVVSVMQEANIDFSYNAHENISQYVNDEWEYVTAVCDEDNETCRVFTGMVKHRLHFGFEDPSNFIGTDMQIMDEFRRIKDEIEATFYRFYKDSLV